MTCAGDRGPQIADRVAFDLAPQGAGDDPAGPRAADLIGAQRESPQVQGGNNARRRRALAEGGPAHASAAHGRRLRMILVERNRAERALVHAGGSPPPSGDVRMQPRIRVELDLAPSR